MSNKPLSGIRVLDLTRVLAGPFAAQTLGDLGAEVIKVERPVTGDECRAYGPAFVKDADGKNTPESAFFLSANRNKKSVTVNIAKPEGQALIRKLAAESDVVIENYIAGTLARYGLDYASLKAVNPRLVYCSLTGYGQDGPDMYRPGYDAVFQAAGGMMGMTGLPDDQPCGGPMKVGPSIVDMVASYHVTIAVLAALRARDNGSGEGQHIDIALLECCVASLSHFAEEYLVSGIVPTRRGTEGNGGMPSQALKCLDGSVQITAPGDIKFRALCEVLGCMELLEDERFDTIAKRSLNRTALTARIAGLAAQWKRDDLYAALDAANIPAGPVRNMAEVFEDKQLQHRGIVVKTQHPVGGEIPLVRNPIRFSRTPIDEYKAPPTMGQHNDEVFGQLLGIGREALDALAKKGIL
ncbi:CaiB/BaiF CoA transferase family protein [Ramlibacter sp.]|uniref:CaiB/BaiF CoA transferase family protein n=1 Tax=Ramlibacter sp. TaxID=1917967 RepID=UPI003D141C4F